MTALEISLPHKRIAILQSNYVPWKGYFDVIASADEFVVFDDVQFTRRDWRNRNKVILAGQVHWLTIPVQTKSTYGAPINAIAVADGVWAAKHLSTLPLQLHILLDMSFPRDSLMGSSPE